jgi:CRP-like cAMP-binding protein
MNQHIYKENEEPNYLYVVKKGLVDLNKKIDLKNDEEENKDNPDDILNKSL